MLHQLYQYDDAIIRWSWRQVRGGRGGAGITADDDDTGTTLAVSNIGLVKWCLRLMSFECSPVIRESHWDIDCQLLVGESFTGFGSVIWALGCVVSSSKHQRSRSLTLSVGGPSKRRCQSLVTMILVELQTANSSSSSNEWMKVDDVDDDEPEIWIKYRVSLPRAYDSCECLSMVMIDWLIECQLAIDQTNRYRVIDWVSISLARGCLIAWMRFVLTLTHTHWHWGTHTHTQWCKYQSGDAQIKCQRASMSQRLAVCVWQVEQSLLILTRAYGCCSWVIERFHFRVCVLIFLSLWVREHADTRWMIGDRTREIKWWWLNHERQHYTLSLSLELWEQEWGGQHYPLEIDVGVCLNTNDRERLMLIVLCYWLCLQLLHVDLITHHQTNVVLPTQQRQTHCQTPTSSTSTFTYSLPQQKQLNRERERERERERNIFVLVVESWHWVGVVYQLTNEQHQSSSLLDWLPDWLNLSIIINHQSCVGLVMMMMMILMKIAHQQQHNHNKYYYHRSSMKLSLRQYVKDRSWRFNLFLINMRTFILAMVTWEIHLFI